MILMTNRGFLCWCPQESVCTVGYCTLYTRINSTAVFLFSLSICTFYIFFYLLQVLFLPAGSRFLGVFLQICACYAILCHYLWSGHHHHPKNGQWPSRLSLYRVSFFFFRREPLHVGKRPDLPVDLLLEIRFVERFHDVNKKKVLLNTGFTKKSFSIRHKREALSGKLSLLCAPLPAVCGVWWSQKRIESSTTKKPNHLKSTTFLQRQPINDHSLLTETLLSLCY